MGRTSPTWVTERTLMIESPECAHRLLILFVGKCPVCKDEATILRTERQGKRIPPRSPLMRRTTLPAVVLLLLLVGFVQLPAQVAVQAQAPQQPQSTITTPKEHFGFNLGDD